MDERTVVVSVGIAATDDQAAELINWLESLAVVVEANADNTRLGVYDLRVVLGTDDNIEAEAWTFDVMRQFGFEPLWLATE